MLVFPSLLLSSSTFLTVNIKYFLENYLDQAVEFTRGNWTAEGYEFFPVTHPATHCCQVAATDSIVK
jgi:hypothetical protein